MELLYLAPIRLPTEKAHGIQIMETCAAMSRAGAEIELVIPNRKTHIKEDPFNYYSIKERFPITRLRVPDTVSCGRFGFIFYAVIFAIRAAFYSRRIGADFIYTRDPITLCTLGVFRVRPLAWEIHTAHPRVPKFIMRGVSAFVPITRGLARWYEARGVPAADIHVAPDAVDLSLFNAVKDRQKERAALRARLEIPAESKIALYIGSFGLYAWKGVDVARKAAEHAPEIRWLFVGGTAKECEELTRGAPKQVMTLPRVRREDIANLLCAADVLLLPNKSGDPASERDTSPMKLFEYMASGVPVVASDVPSLREVLNKRNSFLAPPNDPKALAEEVRGILSNPDEAEARASAARIDVEAYTWDKRAEDMLNFLKQRTKTG
ncbi:MAG TPA: glycosyltransferase family 4 protein [Candidatus Paceibacterota bacterium]|nr:glycosyltransferase family 4 protein [Candidatus Paceibacterota bacterium]